MSNLLRSYNKIYSLLHELETDNNFLNQVRTPKLNDKQLVALNLAAEGLGIDSERYLFKQLPDELKPMIERSVYNRRRRALSFKIEEFRQKMSHQIVEFSEHHIIDSMPVEICKFARANRSKVCRDTEDRSPSHGYCAAQKTHYVGYKLHAVCTANGVFKAFDITNASVHDIRYLNDVKAQFSHCVLIGDRGYLSRQYQQDLFECNSISLATPARKNQLNPQPFSRSFSKARKRIETLFSQLCDQFMIRRNYAKSFSGFATRIISKITALTVIQWINKRSGNNINNLKIVIS